jgi:hypothetical protein
MTLDLSKRRLAEIAEFSAAGDLAAKVRGFLQANVLSLPDAKQRGHLQAGLKTWAATELTNQQDRVRRPMFTTALGLANRRMAMLRIVLEMLSPTPTMTTDTATVNRGPEAAR